MAYFALTQSGEEFINFICGKGGNDLLKGKKNIPLPYTLNSNNTIWETNIVFNNKTITTSNQLSEALIFWFNKYAKEFELDANIIAAQAYAESNYVMWNYSTNSTASGVNQFTMLTIFGVIVTNSNKPKNTTDINDISKITINLKNPLVKNSYNVSSKTPEDAQYNRPILHQNVINNPDIMIRAQCKYMKSIADKSNSLASTSLYCYNRGIAFEADTYSNAITKSRTSKYHNDYYLEGVNYVLKVFGILGDKNNNIAVPDLNGKKTTNYKPKGYYFGYDNKMGNDPRNLKLNETFDPFIANVNESNKFITDGYENDIVIKELSKYPQYELIYFPENQYYREKNNKTQIVLHHTVSGEGTKNDIQWWKSKGEKIATSFIVGRDGEINQLFSTDYWAHHLGIKETVFTEYDVTNITNKLLNEKSIGIEIDSWGGLIQSGGFWYPAMTDGDTQKLVANTKIKPIENVITYGAPDYPNGFHGFYGFEKYTDEQIAAVKKIIQAIVVKWKDIPLKYVNDLYTNTNMWGTYNKTNNKWFADKNALNGKPGIWTHVSYRSDKSDCHPMPELVNMLKSLI